MFHIIFAVKLKLCLRVSWAAAYGGLGHSGVAEHMFGNRTELGEGHRTRVPQEMIRTYLESLSDSPIGYVEAEVPCRYTDPSIVLCIHADSSALRDSVTINMDSKPGSTSDQFRFRYYY